MQDSKALRRRVSELHSKIKGSIIEQSYLVQSGNLKKDEAIPQIKFKTLEEIVAAMYTPEIELYIESLEENLKSIRKQLVEGCERAGLFEEKPRVYNFHKGDKK
jgi:hypothetical protein